MKWWSFLGDVDVIACQLIGKLDIVRYKSIILYPEINTYNMFVEIEVADAKFGLHSFLVPHSHPVVHLFQYQDKIFGCKVDSELVKDQNWSANKFIAEKVIELESTIHDFAEGRLLIPVEHKKFIKKYRWGWTFSHK